MKTISCCSKTNVSKSMTRLGCGLGSLILAINTHAFDPGFVPEYEFDIEYTSMDLNRSGVLMPLGPNWSPILVDIHFGESANHLSAGKTYATSALGNATGPRNSPPSLGELFFVASSFNLTFDISFKDIDPAVNFGGSLADGSSLSYSGVGPGEMRNYYQIAADPNAPNYGLIPPPEPASTIGLFSIEFLLGADLNGNGEADKIKFTLAALTAGDQNRTFVVLPDGTVIDNFDGTMDINGAVVDAHVDPPFSFTLTGPVTGSSHLVEPEPQNVPEGSNSLLLLSGSMLGLLGLRLRSKRS